MDRETLLDLLTARILSRRVEDRPFKVAIDGRCAAGKSILTDELRARLAKLGVPTSQSSIDGFHHPQERRYRQGEHSAQGYYEDAYDYQAVIGSLLKPLPVGTILLFEGIFVLRRELNPFWDLRILVEANPDVVLFRALARDTGLLGPVDVVRKKYESRYDPAWLLYENIEHPESKADIVIDNSDPAHPRILKPLTL